MFWLHLGIWPDNLGNFDIFLVCPCRSVLVPLCPISTFHLCYLLVGTLDLPLVLCQCLRVPAAGNSSYGSCSWKKCSGRVWVTGKLSSSHLHYKTDLQGSSPPASPSFSFMSEESTIHPPVQWPKERWSSFPCFQVAQCFLGSVTTQTHLCPPGDGLSTWPCCWQHHPSHCCDCLLLTLRAVKSHQKDCLLQVPDSPEKSPQDFGRLTVENGGAFTGLENEAVPWPEHFLVLMLA